MPLKKKMSNKDKLDKVKKSELLDIADKIIYENDLITHLKEEVEHDDIDFGQESDAPY